MLFLFCKSLKIILNSHQSEDFWNKLLGAAAQPVRSKLCVTIKLTIILQDCTIIRVLRVPVFLNLGRKSFIAAFLNKFYFECHVSQEKAKVFTE